MLTVPFFRYHLIIVPGRVMLMPAQSVHRTTQGRPLGEVTRRHSVVRVQSAGI